MYDERTKKISLINLEAECRFEKQKNHENFSGLDEMQKKSMTKIFSSGLDVLQKGRKLSGLLFLLKIKKLSRYKIKYKFLDLMIG
jgi:hypothetical protein